MENLQRTGNIKGHSVHIYMGQGRGDIGIECRSGNDYNFAWRYTLYFSFVRLIRVVVKIKVPFWIPIIIRHRIFGVPKKGSLF